MGTRSLTIVNDYGLKRREDGEIVVMYRQYDGYPDGHGSELAEFLDGLKIVNGIGANTPEKAANGMDCLAAQIVAHFKKDIGGFYLYPSGTRAAGEEYIYLIDIKESDQEKVARTGGRFEVTPVIDAFSVEVHTLAHARKANVPPTDEEVVAVKLAEQENRNWDTYIQRYRHIFSGTAKEMQEWIEWYAEQDYDDFDVRVYPLLRSIYDESQVRGRSWKEFANVESKDLS